MPGSIGKKSEPFRFLSPAVELNEVTRDILDPFLRARFERLPLGAAKFGQFGRLSFFRGILLNPADVIEIDIQNVPAIINNFQDFVFESLNPDLFQAIKPADPIVSVDT